MPLPLDFAFDETKYLQLTLMKNGRKNVRTIIVSNKIPIKFLFAHRLRHNDNVKSNQKCVFNENIMDWVNDKRALIAPSTLNIVVEIVVIKWKTRIPIRIHLH